MYVLITDSLQVIADCNTLSEYYNMWIVVPRVISCMNISFDYVRSCCLNGYPSVGCVHIFRVHGAFKVFGDLQVLQWTGLSGKRVLPVIQPFVSQENNGDYVTYEELSGTYWCRLLSM